MLRHGRRWRRPPLPLHHAPGRRGTSGGRRRITRRGNRRRGGDIWGGGTTEGGGTTPLLIRSVVDVPLPIGWVPAPETRGPAPLLPSPISPADFDGFDGASRRLLGDAVARRGVPARPFPPSLTVASLPPPLTASGRGCPPPYLPVLNAPSPAHATAALYRLPAPVGARLEVALVQATLSAGVAGLGCVALTINPTLPSPLPHAVRIARRIAPGPRRGRTPNGAADEPDRESRRWAQQQRNRMAAARCNDAARLRRAAARAAVRAAAEADSVVAAAGAAAGRGMGGEGGGGAGRQRSTRGSGRAAVGGDGGAASCGAATIRGDTKGWEAVEDRKIEQAGEDGSEPEREPEWLALRDTRRVAEQGDS